MMFGIVVVVVLGQRQGDSSTESDSEGSTLDSGDPRSPEAYDKLITDECAKESHSVQKMRAVWKGARRGWCAYDYGSEAPDLHFTTNNTSSNYAVWLRRTFRTSAHASGH